MTNDEIKGLSVEKLLEELDYCGCDTYYLNYRNIVVAEIKSRLNENEQLKQDLLVYQNAICNRECAEVWAESERLKKENEQLKAQIEKMKCCHSCKFHILEDLKNCQTCDGDYSEWELAE